MIIKSKNLNVDEEGNLKAKRGEFSGSITGSTITGTTINTDKDLTVGNNAYIGQNQTSNYSDQKFIYFSGNTYLKRYLIGTSEALYMVGQSASRMVSGNQYIQTSLGGNFASSGINIGSDKRLKKDIKNVDVNWIDNIAIKEFEYKKIPGKKQIGVIAQDYIDKDYSKYFLNKNIDGYYSVTYVNITNALIKYCQELKKQVIQLEKRVSKLEGEVNE